VCARQGRGAAWCSSPVRLSQQPPASVAPSAPSVIAIRALSSSRPAGQRDATQFGNEIARIHIYPRQEKSIVNGMTWGVASPWQAAARRGRRTRVRMTPASLYAAACGWALG